MDGNKYIINNLPASKEEWYIYNWLLELKKEGYIKTIDFQPKSFELSKGFSKRFYKIKQLKTKTVKKYSNRKFLINPHIYTPDFKILWLLKANNIFIQDILLENNLDIPLVFNYNKEGMLSYFEVKATYDKNNMTRMFTSHIQPLIWDKHSTYISLVKPYELFRATFIPQSLLSEFYYLKSGKWGKKGDKKFKWIYKTLKEYTNE